MYEPTSQNARTCLRHPDVAERLRRLLTEWEQDVDAEAKRTLGTAIKK
jgi:hypothetical protein